MEAYLFKNYSEKERNEDLSYFSELSNAIDLGKWKYSKEKLEKEFESFKKFTKRKVILFSPPFHLILSTALIALFILDFFYRE
jgi:hypothetical protein